MVSPEHQAIIDKIQNKIYSVADRPRSIIMMVYGPPGVGKSRFAATSCLVPECNRVLCAAIEPGDETYREFPDVQMYPVDYFNEMNNLHWYIRSMKSIRTVILDTTTELQKKSMDGILAENHKKNPTKHDADVPQLADWGKNTEQMRKVLRAFRDLGINVIFVAHSEKDKDEATGAISIGPSFTPKLKIDACSYVDIIGYMYTKLEGDKTVRYMLTQPSGNITAKCRREVAIPRVIEDPTFPKLWDYLNGVGGNK